MKGGPLIENIVVSCYTIPTETPESDGTLSWTETTLILVEAQTGGETGIGYSYADVATGKLVESLLSHLVRGTNAFDIPGAYISTVRKIRERFWPKMLPPVLAKEAIAVDNLIREGRFQRGMALMGLLQ
jgi:hypothetical protein